MGNYISCTLSGPVTGKASRGTQVIFPSGEIRRLHEPTKAAELMLEAPSHFLVNTASLHIGRRFSALNADEDLEINNVYVFFPMKRLHSVVAAADMGPLFLAANSAARILPADVCKLIGEGSSAPAPSPSPKLNLDEVEELSAGPEFKRRLTMCRSRKPLLETIVEEPVRLR